MPIRFFSEEVSFKIPHPRKTANWIKLSIQKEKGQPGDINYIFCSDRYLLDINKEYLNHNSLTDIITFDTRSTKSSPISADIYISIERVKDNAKTLEIGFDSELHRVMIHGVLHLVGYKDKSKANKAQMRKKEEAYLSLRK